MCSSDLMGELMGQPFVLDFKPGAGGVIGTGMVAKAPADGHTLLLMSGNFTVMPAVYRNLPFDTLRDFAPVSLVSETYMILITPPAFPAQGLAQYLAHARSNPGKVNVGATGQAGVNHLMNVWLHSLAGVQVTHVPYKGAALLFPDLLADRKSTRLNSSH